MTPEQLRLKLIANIDKIRSFPIILSHMTQEQRDVMDAQYATLTADDPGQLTAYLSAVCGRLPQTEYSPFKETTMFTAKTKQLAATKGFNIDTLAQILADLKKALPGMGDAIQSIADVITIFFHKQPALKAAAPASCPTPDPSCQCACLHCATHHFALAVACGTECCSADACGQNCDWEAKAQEVLCHVLAGIADLTKCCPCD